LDKLTTEKEYEVNYYEIDFRKKLLVTSLINYFEDTATKQSQDVGNGLNYMEKNKIAWVLYKWDINIDRYPSFRENIRVRTSAYSFRKFYGYRTFEVVDADDNIICRAKSIWLLMDTDKRRVKKISDDMYSIYRLNKEIDNKPLDIDNVHLPEKFTYEKYFNVRYSDIDTNMHVNNVKYLDWAIETVPLEIVLNYSIKSLNVTYKKETTYGKKIKSSTEVVKRGNNYIAHHLISDDDGKKLCIIRTIWQK
jgi:medium-chain acyl-[acyl-carrier-protein] hydrolase